MQDLNGPYFIDPATGKSYFGVPLPFKVSVQSDLEIPEPGTAALLGAGLLLVNTSLWRSRSFGELRRRRRKTEND